MSSGNGRGLVMPNQMDLGVHCHDGPHAQPIMVVVPKPGAIEVHAWGGLSKLEAAAIQIAAGMAGRGDPVCVKKLAVTLAMEVLDECRKASQPKPEEQA